MEHYVFFFPHTLQKNPFNVKPFSGVKKTEVRKHYSRDFSEFLIMLQLQQWFTFSHPMAIHNK